MEKLLGKKSPVWLLLAVIFLISFVKPREVAGAPGDTENCTPPFNLSNTEDYLSVDPFLLADPAGKVHLFWAEKMPSENVPTNAPDGLIYAVWDGENWSEPVDIFLSPADHVNRKIAGIRAVLDGQGIIHLMWLGPDNTLYYSNAQADAAGSASAWQKPRLMTSEQTGSQYSTDLAYEPPQTIHIMYGKGPSSRQDETAPRAIAYVRSVDGGLTWSDPMELYTFYDLDRGASNIRLAVDQPNKIYATFTEWDTTGNGQAVLFFRSTDSGNSWSYPHVLDTREGVEYERDWTNLAVLGEDELVVLWEGGFRAYPQTQYSYDGGLTWSDPFDTFYWLIADNGYASFARDSAGRLHTFLPRRIREGYTDYCSRFPGCGSGESDAFRNQANALWHSVWEGETRWREPLPAGGFQSKNDESIAVGGNYTSAVIYGGNKLMAAWFDYTNFEVVVMHCEIEDALAVAPQPQSASVPTPTPKPVPSAMSTVVKVTETAQPSPTSYSDDGNEPSSGFIPNPGIPILLGIIPALLVITGIVLFLQFRNRTL